MTYIVEKFAAAYREVAMMDRDRMTMAEQAYYFGGVASPPEAHPNTLHAMRKARARHRRPGRG